MLFMQLQGRPPTDTDAAYYDVYGVIEDFPRPDLSRSIGILSELQQASLFSHRPGNVANRFAVMICKNIDNFLRGHQHLKPPRSSGLGFCLAAALRARGARRSSAERGTR
jgi:hypothetical protein